MEPVSVVIPTYQRAALLRLALDSVARAISPGDEVIVVDDGSTDNTEEVVGALVRSWSGSLRYLKLSNGGAGRARNAGVRAASHDLIAFVDSDDEWLPWRLDVQRPLLCDEPSLGFCFANFAQIHKDGSMEPGWLVQWSQDRRGWSEILGPGQSYVARWPIPGSLSASVSDLQWHRGTMYLQELGANYINVNTLLARRSVLGASLHFGEGLPTFEDWECFARITRTAACAYIDLDVASQRAHEGPRLTGATILTRLRTRIGIIERTWLQDPDFVQKHRRYLERVLRDLRQQELRQLVVAGQREQALTHLRLHGGSWKDRIALSMPDAILRRLLPSDK